MMSTEQWAEVLPRVNELTRRVDDLMVRTAALKRDTVRTRPRPEEIRGQAQEPIRDAT